LGRRFFYMFVCIGLRHFRDKVGGMFQTLQNISVLTIASPKLKCRLYFPFTWTTSMKVYKKIYVSD
jgi:hypothetical protein